MNKLVSTLFGICFISFILGVGGIAGAIELNDIGSAITSVIALVVCLLSYISGVKLGGEEYLNDYK